MSDSPTRRAMVFGRRYFVTVEKRPGGVWVAKGSYKGGWIQVEGSSEEEAVRRWKEAAEMKGI